MHDVPLRERPLGSRTVNPGRERRCAVVTRLRRPIVLSDYGGPDAEASPLVLRAWTWPSRPTPSHVEACARGPKSPGTNVLEYAGAVPRGTRLRGTTTQADSTRPRTLSISDSSSSTGAAIEVRRLGDLARRRTRAAGPARSEPDHPRRRRRDAAPSCQSPASETANSRRRQAPALLTGPRYSRLSNASPPPALLRNHRQSRRPRSWAVRHVAGAFVRLRRTKIGYLTRGDGSSPEVSVAPSHAA